MRFLFRWAFRLLVLAILLGVAALLLKDILAEEWIERRLEADTGLEVRVDRAEVGLLEPAVTLEGLRLYNPAAFGGGPLVVVRELHVEYDRSALVRGVLRLGLLRLEVQSLTLVQNEDGRWNLEVLAAETDRRASSAERRLQFGGIDVLNLSFERLRWYSMADPRDIHEWRVGLHDEVFRSLRQPADLLRVAGELAVRLGVQAVLEGAAVGPP